MPRRAPLVLLALLALFGCRRGPTGPDANYEKASRVYQQLYATQLDDAYGDPRMDEVAALLKKVDPNSMDAHAAQAMLDSIGHGREVLARQRAEREKMAAAAARSASALTSIDPDRIIAAASPPDAGPAQDPFGDGAMVASINSQSGGCLSAYEPFTEQGTNVTGTVYRLSPADVCKVRLPGFVGQAVLVVNGKIYRRIPDPAPPGSSAPPQAAAQDAGAPPAPSPRAAAAPSAPPPAPTAPPAAQAAGAGQPEYPVAIPSTPEPAPAPEQPGR